MQIPILEIKFDTSLNDLIKVELCKFLKNEGNLNYVHIGICDIRVRTDFDDEQLDKMSKKPYARAHISKYNDRYTAFIYLSSYLITSKHFLIPVLWHELSHVKCHHTDESRDNLKNHTIEFEADKYACENTPKEQVLAWLKEMDILEPDNQDSNSHPSWKSRIDAVQNLSLG